MKKTLLYIGMGLVLVGVMMSCKRKKNSQETPQSEEPPLTDALLWKISGNELKKPSYVFGTFHILKTEDFRLQPQTRQAMDSAEVLVLELALNSEAMAFVQQNSRMDSTSLDSLISPEKYNILKQAIEEKLQLKIEQVNQLKPIFLSQQLLRKVCMNGQTASYELSLMQDFQEQDKAILGLEKVEEQMAFMDKIPPKQQMEAVMKLVESPEESCQALNEMVRLYQEEDVDSLMTLIAEEEALNGLLDQFLDQRNQRWIPKIEEWMTQQSLFIAVGAGHLGGEKGILNLLRKKGYQLEAVKN